MITKCYIKNSMASSRDTVAAKRVKVVKSFYWQSYHSCLNGNLKFVSCHIIRIISAVIVILQ